MQPLPSRKNVRKLVRNTINQERWRIWYLIHRCPWLPKAQGNGKSRLLSFLTSLVLGKFQLMKFGAQEEFIPTARCFSEVASKSQDYYWKTDNSPQGQHQFSEQLKTSKKKSDIPFRKERLLQTKLYLLTWNSELVLSPPREWNFPVIIKPSHLDLGHHTDQNICLLRVR